MRHLKIRNWSNDKVTDTQVTRALAHGFGLPVGHPLNPATTPAPIPAIDQPAKITPASLANGGGNVGRYRSRPNA
jgi:hypothetical protein